MSTAVQSPAVSEGQPTRDVRRPTRILLDCLLVTLLLVAYAGVQSRYVMPPILSDQLHYFFDANILPEVTPPLHHSLRLGLVIPTWAAIRAFGYSELAYYLVPYVATAGLVTSVYVLGRVLGGRLVGAGAAALVIANPFVVVNGSQLLPDIPATAMLTLAGTLLIVVARTASDEPLSLRQRVALVVAGLLIGWAYLTRELIALWLPAIVVILLAYRLRLRRWVWVVLPALAMLLVELGWGLAFFGDPFMRIRAALGHTGGLPWEREATAAYPDTLEGLLLSMPSAVAAQRAGWVLAALAVSLILALVIRRRRALAVLAAWFLVPLVLMLAVNLATWWAGTPLLKGEKTRYWLPLLPPLLVGGLVGIKALVAGIPRWWSTAVLAVLVVAVVASSGFLTERDLSQETGFTGQNRRHYLEFREWLMADGQACESLWVDADDWRSGDRWVEMYVRSYAGRRIWDGEIRALNEGNDFIERDDVRGGAIVRTWHSAARKRQLDLPAPQYFLRPPEQWPELMSSDGPGIRVIAAPGGCGTRSIGPSHGPRPR